MALSFRYKQFFIYSDLGGYYVYSFSLQHLQEAFHQLNVDLDATSLFHKLKHHYNETHRAYHNQQHIQDCLEELKRHSLPFTNKAYIALALWFHDVIYDTHKQDNEEQSAIWTQKILQEYKVTAEIIRKLKELILSTKHTGVHPTCLDAHYLIDIDLSILGRSQKECIAYDALIRKEYGWVKEEHYRKARTRILQKFLDQDWIYYTDTYRKTHEEQARKNIEGLLQQLKQ